MTLMKHVGDLRGCAISVVGYNASLGVVFDYPIDLECHLPTVSRLWSDWFFLEGISLVG